MRASKPKVVVCLGTRPEAIKLAPVILALRRRDDLETVVCATAQHRQMLTQTLAAFALTADIDLDLMTPNQDLARLTGAVVGAMAEVLAAERPACLVVQGDTTTAFASALAAHYQKVRVAHVEAGLRTGDKWAPFPEEANRSMIAVLADDHFAPTEGARTALLRCGVRPEGIMVVGNTVIDALLLMVARTRADDDQFRRRFPDLGDRPMLLVTGHRRESFGPGLEGVCRALQRLAATNPDLDVVYPVHLNPNVDGPVRRLLGGLPRVHLLPPQDYASFVWLLDQCRIVLTDSGGIQEEAPTLGKPVLVTRDLTERPEGVDAGVARLVGTDPERIVALIQRLLDDPAAHAAMARASSPYGDGTAARRIVAAIAARLAPVTAAPAHSLVGR